MVLPCEWQTVTILKSGALVPSEKSDSDSDILPAWVKERQGLEDSTVFCGENFVDFYTLKNVRSLKPITRLRKVEETSIILVVNLKFDEYEEKYF